MAGGAGVEWHFGWQNNSPFSDLSCEDWRRRKNVYRQTKITLDFFHAHLPFWRMQPADETVVGHGVSGLIAPGELLAIYLPNGVDEVVMARRGVVFRRGRAVTNAHNVWSATKSFTSTALGLLVADGTVTLDTRAAEHPRCRWSLALQALGLPTRTRSTADPAR